MTVIGRRGVIAGTAALGLGAIPGARTATPTLAMVRTNQQALFFNQMQGAQGAAEKAG